MAQKTKSDVPPLNRLCHEEDSAPFRLTDSHKVLPLTIFRSHLVRQGNYGFARSHTFGKVKRAQVVLVTKDYIVFALIKTNSILNSLSLAHN